MSIKIKGVLLFSVPLLCVSVFAIGWPQPSPDPLAQEKPPTLHKLEFTGPDEPWPPRPKGQTNIKEIVSEEIPGSLTDDLEDRIRMTAQRNANVSRLLGARFAYIGTDEIRYKERPRQPAEPLVTLVTFFSHTNNTAVEVQMRGEAVVTATTRRGSWPPEGGEEVRDAVELARRDRRLSDKVTGLKEVNGILVEIPRGRLGYGNRVIEVFFGRENEDVPDYHALVDLTTRTVLVAEPLLPLR